MSHWEEFHVLLQVLVAGVLGGLIGLEREIKQRPAGLRTHMLVACASALFVALGSVVVDQLDSKTLGVTVRPDPLRILEAVVTGVSFIGAGTIVFRKGADRLEGITTAGSILLTSAIGVAVALDLYLLASVITVLVVLVLWLLSRVETVITRRFGTQDDG
jgi:putative Mg2+ transporter-C (MgtC) family protein